METTYTIGRMPQFIHEPESVYRAKRGRYLTSHQLADFRRCPLVYKLKRNGLISDRDSTAYAIGRAVHKLALEGSTAFWKEFCVGGPINPKTGNPYGNETKAYREWAEAQGKQCLSDDQFALVASMADAVARHAEAKRLLSDGLAEGVLRADYYGIECQIRVDWFGIGGIADLKTCDDLDDFEEDADRYGYVHQMAFYRSIIANACRHYWPVHLIGVEKREPFRCGVWRLSDETLDLARNENIEAIARLMHCQQTNEWPTGYEAVREL